MPTPPTTALLALSIPLLPALAAALIGMRMLFNAPPSERTTVRVVSLALSGSVIAALALSLVFLLNADHPVVLSLGTWFATAAYRFDLPLQLDSLSVPMLLLVAAISGLTARFSATYLVGEPGHARFYLLLSIFAVGMFLLVMAGSLDLLIVGWELVGLSSMLLIGFFHERSLPVRNALRAFIVYRICDVGLLVAAVLVHHYAHAAAFGALFGSPPWPASELRVGAEGATLVSLCLLWAAMGKSALFPLGSWLPRAMEGPTPSSAIFYGALSVHAGACLLLRVSPLLEQAPLARTAIVGVGAVSAVYGTLVARVQTDVKSQLAYATSTQVSVIFVEIGLGLPRLALAHLLGHACLRTLQLLRAPNAIADRMQVRAAIHAQSDEATETGVHSPSRAAAWCYQTALERFHLDPLWEHLVARPFLRLGALVEQGETGVVRLFTRADSSAIVTASMAEQEGRHAP